MGKFCNGEIFQWGDFVTERFWVFLVRGDFVPGRLCPVEIMGVSNLGRFCNGEILYWGDYGCF